MRRKPLTADEWSRIRTYMRTLTVQQATEDPVLGIRLAGISDGKASNRCLGTHHSLYPDFVEEAMKWCKEDS